jgi:hypothetical protein
VVGTRAATRRSRVAVKRCIPFPLKVGLRSGRLEIPPLRTVSCWAVLGTTGARGTGGLMHRGGCVTGFPRGDLSGYDTG